MALETFLAFMVGVTRRAPRAEEDNDIWNDMDVLHFLTTHQYPSEMSAKARGRVYHWAKAYRWMTDNLFKLLPGGVMVVVPKPGEREKTTLDTHCGMGHFGVQRVLDRLQKKSRHEPN